MPRRSANEPHSLAREVSRPEANARLAKVERTLEDVLRASDQLTRRITSLESQVDYLASKVRPS